MLARLLGTIIERFSAPPLALKVHGALMFAASLVLADTGRGGWWFGPASVAILLWPLLRGSRFVWWVHLLGLGFVLAGAGGAYGKVVHGPPGFDVFLDLPTYVATTLAIGTAWLLLFVPSVRAFCNEYPRRNAFIFAVGVYLLASVPAIALGLDSRVPSPWKVDETRGAIFVGSAEQGPVALYVADRRDRVCLIGLAPSHTSRSCTAKSHLLRNPSSLHVDDVLAGVVPREVERVEVVTDSGAHAVEMIEDERVEVDVYLVVDTPFEEIRRVVGYDRSGAALLRAE
jgi:hypothetical protein